MYFDHNATTPVRPEVLDAMLPFLKGDFGNASSLTKPGQRARKAVEDARAQVASFIGADSPDEVVFTSGGTESNNWAIKGTLAARRSNGRRVVTSAIEHSSVRTVLRNLADKGEIDLVVVPVQPNGILRIEDVADALTPDTVLVSIMAANNEVGTIQPIRAIADLCEKKDVPFHCDAVQMAGKLPIRVNDLGVDLLALSGHKIATPKGVGILYIRKGTRLESLIEGGRQEKNRRGGTENVAGIVGMGMSVQLLKREMPESVSHLAKLRDLFEELITSQISHTFINGGPENRICNTTNICFEYTDNSALLVALDLKGIATSSGSACAAGSPDPSHVLLAMGLPQDKAHASLRFSFGHSTTEEEIRGAVGPICDAVEKLRLSHPLWKKAVNQ